MSNATPEDEMATAMHEFVEEYCREQIGEVGDMGYYHEMIDDIKKREQTALTMESWNCFLEDFQEYISNQ